MIDAAGQVLISLGLFVGSLGATLALAPLVMRLATWLGAVDRAGHRKHSRGPIPLLGGLGVAAPFMVTTAALALIPWVKAIFPQWMASMADAHAGVFLLVQQVRHEFAPLALGGLIVLLLGAGDDIYRLRPAAKLLVQGFAALIVAQSGHTIASLDVPLLGFVHVPAGLGLLITVLWIVGLTNAFNMIDGVDGLAAGVGLIAAVSFTILAALTDNLFVMFLGSILAGSLAAFLRYNFPPGRIFLGDTGSMFLGFIFAAIALMGKHKAQAAVLLAAPILVLALPIIEMVISMTRRFARGHPVFAGDARHTHHKLFKRGLSGRRTVFFLYAVSMLLAGAGICRAAAPRTSPWRFLCLPLYGTAFLAILWAGGYVQGPRTLLARLSRRSQNRLLDSLARYGARALSTNRGLDYGRDILRLFCRHAHIQSVDVTLRDGTNLRGDGDGISRRAVTEHTTEIELHEHKTATLRVAFDRKVDELELQDVTSSLARMFEHARLRDPVDVSLRRGSSVLGIGCNMLDYGTVLDAINAWRESPGDRSRYIIALNPHSVMLSRRNKKVLRAIAGAAMALPDGIGIIWAANILGYSHRGRCTGPTLMLNLCDWGRGHGLRHFFCGGRPGIADRLAARLQQSYPGLEVAGTFSPPFRGMSPEEDRDMCRLVEDARPDVIWVGLGAPKQEQWMADHEAKIRAPVMIGVGAAFDFHSGAIRWAPAWIRNIGMEWAFRLAREPRRLWRRNLDSPLFLFHVILERLKPPAFRRRTTISNGEAAPVSAVPQEPEFLSVEIDGPPRDDDASDAGACEPAAAGRPTAT